MTKNVTFREVRLGKELGGQYKKRGSIKDGHSDTDLNEELNAYTK